MRVLVYHRCGFGTPRLRAMNSEAIVCLTRIIAG
jgi:hypothetical protein